MVTSMIEHIQAAIGNAESTDETGTSRTGSPPQAELSTIKQAEL